MSDAMHMARGGDAAPALNRSAAVWLSLAATPAFVLMAAWTGLGGERTAMICGAGPSWLAGMAPMYLLMAAVHAAPWLRRLASGAQAPARRSQKA